MLESWLGTISRVEFFRESYLHKPYAVALGAPRVAPCHGDIFWKCPGGTQRADQYNMTRYNMTRFEPTRSSRARRLSTGTCRGHGEHMQHVFEAEVPDQAIVVEASQATEAVARQLLKRRRDSIAGHGHHQCQWVA
jgi:hypothetical protein